MRSTILFGKTVFILLILTITPLSLFAQRESIPDLRVAIVPLWLEGDNIPEAYQTDQAIRQILWSTIPIEGNYQIEETLNYPKTTANIATFAKTQQFDIVIYGTIKTDTKRKVFEISLFTYSKKFNKILTQVKREIPTGPEKKEKMEMLTIDFLEILLKKQLRFGSISFTNNGKGDFIVFANGKLIGENIKEISLFPIGKHLFQIEKIRGFEKIPIYERKVLVRVGKKENITFESLDEYGKIKFQRRESKGEVILLIDGQPSFSLPKTGDFFLSPGIHLVEIIQYDYKNKKHIAFQEKLTILANKTIFRTIETPLWGYGLIFHPKGSEDYTVYIDEEKKGDNLKKIDVLSQGFHKIKILQTLEKTEICIFEGSVDIGNTQDQTIIFSVYKTLLEAKSDGIVSKQPVYPQNKTKETKKNPSNKYGNEPIIDLTLDLKTLKTGFFWVGLNIEMFKKMLMAGVYVGFSVLEEDFFLLGEGNIHFQPFPRWIVSPYLGASFMDIYDFDFEQNSMYIGPQIGLQWNTGWFVISAVYIEVVYYFDILKEEQSGINIGIGIGLF